MIALDTNVLVRYLVEDDRKQSATAAALIDRAVTDDEMLFISDIVLCELVWVLAGSYRVGRARIASTVKELLRAKHVSFAAPDQLSAALQAYVAGKGDFADYVIRAHAAAAGCEAVVTFDRDLLKDSGFIAAR